MVQFLDGFKFFGNADSYRGFAPIAGSRGLVRIFLFFWIWVSEGLVVRMGAERRFASLLRIAAPSVER